MKLSYAPFLAFLLFPAAGCGGLPVPGGEKMTKDVSLYATPSTVAVNAASVVDLSQSGYGETTYELAVKEGAAGGTLTLPTSDPSYGISRVYTAPATPGTYHLVGTVTETNGKVHTRTLKVVVTP